MNEAHHELDYILYKPRAPITLNLFEAERYEAAVIVQQLVGNLVVYSNKGRYEPRLAKQWFRSSPNLWQFDLHEGLTCENGELITPKSFTESLNRIIKIISEKSTIPVFSHLKGYSSFLNGAAENISGIRFNSKSIFFEFDTPVRSGLIQMLSFAPFGYICKENFNPDLRHWRDPESFISSGPYMIKHLEIGSRYTLSRNPRWKLPFEKNAPTTIRFSHQIPTEIAKGRWIIDSSMKEMPPPQGLRSYTLVPEYLNAILLGNLKNGYFSELKVRTSFADDLRKYRAELPAQFGAHVLSSAFYPNQQLRDESRATIIHEDQNVKMPQNKIPLIIEGKEPHPDSPTFSSWKVLKKVLEKRHLKYRFNLNQTNADMVSNRTFDIRLSVTSIGGDVEPWGIGLIFCSGLGVGLPDPSGKICQLVHGYERDEVNLDQFKDGFFKQLKDDQAIIPISHFGGRLFLSPSIDATSISPAINVIRFDQLQIE